MLMPLMWLGLGGARRGDMLAGEWYYDRMLRISWRASS
jgi:hypothetical protein